VYESPLLLALGLATGIGFGFLLQKGGVTKHQTILGQLLLKDWRVLKIMATAIVTGAVGVYALHGAEATILDIWPFQVAAVLLGALCFGVGLAVIGYCPGTGMAASGEGSRDAMVGVLGMIAGAGILVLAYDALEPIALALGDRGKVTLADVSELSPWVVIATLALLVYATLAVVDRYEKKGLPSDERAEERPSEDRRTAVRRRSSRLGPDRRSGQRSQGPLAV
jgi:uncharacterized membrane protein YedE/YeeE